MTKAFQDAVPLAGILEPSAPSSNSKLRLKFPVTRQQMHLQLKLHTLVDFVGRSAKSDRQRSDKLAKKSFGHMFCQTGQYRSAIVIHHLARPAPDPPRRKVSHRCGATRTIPESLSLQARYILGRSHSFFCQRLGALMAARPPAAAQSSSTLEVEIADAGGHYRSKTALKTSDKGDRNKVTVACVEALGFSANLADGSRKRSIPLDWRCPGQRSWADTFSCHRDC